jgi:hypothetical protein
MPRVSNRRPILTTLVASTASVSVSSAVKASIWTSTAPFPITEGALSLAIPMRGGEGIPRRACRRCYFEFSPQLYDIYVSDNCNAHTDSFSSLGGCSPNDTGLDGKTVLTGSQHFTVKDIKLFEATG